MDTYTTPGGRIWKRVGEEPYTRRDGTSTTLLVWECFCAKCGMPIWTKTPVEFGRSKSFGKKHCDAHKDPICVARGKKSVQALQQRREQEAVEGRVPTVSYGTVQSGRPMSQLSRGTQKGQMSHVPTVPWDTKGTDVPCPTSVPCPVGHVGRSPCCCPTAGCLRKEAPRGTRCGAGFGAKNPHPGRPDGGTRDKGRSWGTRAIEKC